MLGLQQLTRMLELDRSNLVLEACAKAGGPLPISIRLQFESSGSLRSSAVAFALKRMTDLSYRITPPIEHASELLLEHQLEDGSFSNDDCPAVTIAAVSALSAVLDLTDRAGGTLTPALARLAERVSTALGHAIDSLRSTRAMTHDGLLGDTQTTAYLLLAIARSTRLQEKIDPAELSGTLRDAGALHDRHAAALLAHAERLLGTGHCFAASTAA